MKNFASKKYNLVAFVIIPVAIVLVSITFCILVGGSLFSPTLDYDDVTPQTESGELWKVLAVIEGEYAYVIYSVDNAYKYDDARLIAFQGPDIETIQKEVTECDTGNEATSYWEGEGTSFNFSNTFDFKQYLSKMERITFTNGAPDSDVVIANFSEVTLYDLSDYVGYEKDNKSGEGLAVVIMFILVGAVTLIVLAVELLVAFALKKAIAKCKSNLM